jgi:hypothetical protein
LIRITADAAINGIFHWQTEAGHVSGNAGGGFLNGTDAFMTSLASNIMV